MNKIKRALHTRFTYAAGGRLTNLSIPREFTEHVWLGCRTIFHVVGWDIWEQYLHFTETRRRCDRKIYSARLSLSIERFKRRGSSVLAKSSCLPNSRTHMGAQRKLVATQLTLQMTKSNILQRLLFRFAATSWNRSLLAQWAIIITSCARSDQQALTTKLKSISWNWALLVSRM